MGMTVSYPRMLHCIHATHAHRVCEEFNIDHFKYIGCVKDYTICHDSGKYMYLVVNIVWLLFRMVVNNKKIPQGYIYLLI